MAEESGSGVARRAGRQEGMSVRKDDDDCERVCERASECVCVAHRSERRLQHTLSTTRKQGHNRAAGEREREHSQDSEREGEIPLR